jgi:hypothetical protein
MKRIEILNGKFFKLNFIDIFGIEHLNVFEKTTSLMNTNFKTLFNDIL